MSYEVVLSFILSSFRHHISNSFAMPTLSLRIVSSLLNLFSFVFSKADFTITTIQSQDGMTSSTQNVSSTTSRIQQFTKTCGRNYIYLNLLKVFSADIISP